MGKERTKKEILDDLEYARGRYRDYTNAGQKENAKIIENDIKELERELKELGYTEE